MRCTERLRVESRKSRRGWMLFTGIALGVSLVGLSGCGSGSSGQAITGNPDLSVTRAHGVPGGGSGGGKPSYDTATQEAALQTLINSFPDLPDGMETGLLLKLNKALSLLQSDHVAGTIRLLEGFISQVTETLETEEAADAAGTGVLTEDQETFLEGAKATALDVAADLKALLPGGDEGE